MYDIPEKQDNKLLTLSYGIAIFRETIHWYRHDREKRPYYE